jgi:hypothetical protein
MSGNRQKAFALAISLISLAALVELIASLSAPAHAQTSVPPAEGQILVSLSDATQTDDVLYVLHPDDTRLFDFHSHPKDTTARIWQPRISPDANTVYFSSDNANNWGPADRNLFRIAFDGRWWDQITPGPNSGLWNQPCPCGTVEGTVYKTTVGGEPLGDSRVFLEGKRSIHSDASGSFRFENVPVGRRWIVAYQDGFTLSDAVEIDVPAGGTVQVDLVPNKSERMTFERPIPYGDRIYHVLDSSTIQWTDLNASSFTNIYSATAHCSLDDVPDVDSFDVAPNSGRLAILDYEWNCNTNPGLYITDRDGKDAQLLVDMTDTRWCGTGDVFWAPDEDKIAFEACFNETARIWVYDSSDGSVLGSGEIKDPSYSLDLYGWSPDGNWLLYASYLSPASKALYQVGLNADGSLNDEAIVNLLSEASVSGATWGILKLPGMYLPLIARDLT